MHDGLVSDLQTVVQGAKLIPHAAWSTPYECAYIIFLVIFLPQINVVKNVIKFIILSMSGDSRV